MWTPPGETRYTDADLPAPSLYSAVSATALAAHRDLSTWAAKYGDLLPEDDLAPICLLRAWHAPWHTAAQLRLHNRMSTWLLALAEAPDDLLGSCADVLDGGEATNPLAACLADIWTDLTAQRLWPPLAKEWRALFDDTLAALRAEPLVRPTPEQYAANSDSATVRIASFTYWIAAGDHTVLDHVDALLPALWESQVAIRWADRDQPASMNLTATEVQDLAAAAATRCTNLLAPLLTAEVPEALALDRMTRSAISY